MSGLIKDTPRLESSGLKNTWDGQLKWFSILGALAVCGFFLAKRLIPRFLNARKASEESFHAAGSSSAHLPGLPSVVAYVKIMSYYLKVARAGYMRV
jgi:hypothetical protein